MSRFLCCLFSLAVLSCSSESSNTPAPSPDTGVDASKDTSSPGDDTSVGPTDTAAPADTDCGGKTCAADEVCVSGTCQCAPPKAYCGTGCVDVTTSNTHCGMCDKACVDK